MRRRIRTLALSRLAIPGWVLVFWQVIQTAGDVDFVISAWSRGGDTTLQILDDYAWVIALVWLGMVLFWPERPSWMRRDESESSREATLDSPEQEPVPAQVPWTEMGDEQFAALYETKMATDPTWERSLKTAAGGLAVQARYDKIQGRPWEDLGTKEYLGVLWRGYDTGNGVCVYGPYCPNEPDELLHHSIAGISGALKDSHPVGRRLASSLYCRRCGSNYYLGTGAGGQAVEKVGDCRVDVMNEFERDSE